ncbi:Hydantoinase/oxoprolinase domain-containing protein isoform 3 [Cladophialophora immunda]|nr:Hydantoinase/oxoprolinase domain-containing protein isoform 3 [Cladophialophora immunda]
MIGAEATAVGGVMALNADEAHTEYFRVGIDVGGTNTDAALVGFPADAARNEGIKPYVVAKSKAETSADITTGICDALEAVFDKTSVSRSRILSVNIGTTHFINAIVQADRTKINRVAVLRLCGPFCREVEPFAGFPPRLKDAVCGYWAYLNGGLEIDGRIITEVDEEEVLRHTQTIKDAGIVSVAVVGVFSPVDTAPVTQEQRVRDLILKQYPGCHVVCSRDIGAVGLVERENASILNAAILDLSQKTITGFERAMIRSKLDCRLYLTQNDGTVMSASAARLSPIRTFSSGATNSLIGGIFLTGIQNPDSMIDLKSSQVILVDVGGTTSDFAALSPTGFPREAPSIVEIGGVRTAFRMPQVYSMGLGGGSRVQEVDGEVSVGPISVGYKLATESRCFGGDVLTATDIAVARNQVGSIVPKWNGTPPDRRVVERASRRIKKLLQRGVDAMKTSDLDVVLLLVGGGSIIQMDDLEGVSQCLRPAYYDVANAVGAAIAKVSGELDTVQIPNGRTHQEIQRELSGKAIELAVQNGAQPGTVKIVDVEFIPLQYMKNEAVRVIIKAIGELGTSRPSQEHSILSPDLSQVEVNGIVQSQKDQTRPEQPAISSGTDIDVSSYVPAVSKEKGEWYLSETDLEFIADGCGVLGTGGGGPTYSGLMHSKQVVRTSPANRMRVIEVASVRDEDPVATVAYIGAPTVFNERLCGDSDLYNAVSGLAAHLGVPKLRGIIPGEIGGSNGMRAFAAAAQLDIPVIDADTMARAFPRIDLELPAVFGATKPYPAVMADARGNIQVIASADNQRRLENLARAICIEFGNMTGFSRSIGGEVTRKYCPHNTISQTWYIGRAIRIARQRKESVIGAVLDVLPGAVLLYHGKVGNVTNSTRGGWSFGMTILNPDHDDDDDDEYAQEALHRSHRPMLLEFQNEYLHAALVSASASQRPETVCSSPDMITLLERPSGVPLATNELRFGLRVAVVAYPCHELWKTPEGIKAACPAAFGIDTKYTPLPTQWTRPRSVIEEYAR